MNITLMLTGFLSVLLFSHNCIGQIKDNSIDTNLTIPLNDDYSNFIDEEETFGLTRLPNGQTLIDYVKSKYEQVVENRQCLFYPAANAKQLVITFGAAGKGKINYTLWSWFWNENEKWDNTAYLFLRDLDETWYFGFKEKSFVEDYSKIINHFIELSNVPKEHVITLGLSMGGAAALFYSVLLKLKGVFAVNPVVDKNVCSLNSCPKVWCDLIPACRWQNIFELISDSKELPRTSLLIGTLNYDELSAYNLIDAFKKKNANVILHHVKISSHSTLVTSTGITKNIINNEIDYLDQNLPSLNKVDESCVAPQQSIEPIQRKYIRTIAGKTCLFYPAKKANRLLIIFASENKDYYSMSSWFWRTDENWNNTAYLFLKDDKTWYLGGDKQSYLNEYCQLINAFIKISKVSEEHVFTIGNSFGGYAAILYATILNLKGAIAINPLVKYSDATETQNPTIKILEKQWEDLNDVISRCNRPPRISLIFGSSQQNQIEIETLVDLLKKRIIHLCFHRTLQQASEAVLDTAKTFINQEIDYLDQEIMRLKA